MLSERRISHQDSRQGAVDFNAGYIYIVRILVSRSSTSVTPMFTGVRIY